jgi:hypothetical protein
MAYLYQLSQSLNGKSPAEITALMDGLPPQAAAALSQGLAIVSNHNAISGVPNTQGATDATRRAFIPAAGSMGNLPSGMVAELTRTDRINHGMSTAGAGSGAMARPETTLRGVGALQDVANIFKPAGAGYLNGSEATKSMLAAASQYAEADATHRGASAANPVVAPDQLTVDQHGGGSDPRSALAQIVGVAGQDHVGVHDLVTDPRTRDRFLHGVLTETWGDKSGQVGDAFRWMGDDPHNRIDSETANGIAHYISAHSGELQHMPGGATFAADSPGLAQGMAIGLGPYLAQLAGADPALFNAPGIENFHQRQDMANLFSIFDSDHGAGVTINNAALQQQQFLETHAAHFGIQGNEVEVASRLHQAMIDGADQARHFDQTNQISRAARGDAAMGSMWDTGYGALTAATGLTGATVPGAQLPAAVLAAMESALGPPLKGLLLHPTDTSVMQGDDYITRQLTSPNFGATVAEQATILNGLLDAHPEIAHDGRIAPWLSYDRDGNAFVDPRGVSDDSVAANQISDWFAKTAKEFGYDAGTWDQQEHAGEKGTYWP